MLLRNLEIVGDNSSTVDIRIKDGKINAISSFINAPEQEPVLAFDNVIAFPGLINSHDHLDFNIFPQLGNKLYNNYVEWGSYIHTNNKNTISRVLQIPKELRIKWGIYKNLINGVTTVVNHGPQIKTSNEIITVFQQYHLLHSIQNEKYWKYLLNRPLKKKQPFVIHIGEGRDTESHDEIDDLKKWNLYNREIIGVHGIAMDERQAAFFKALVWCPASNFFLIGKTAPVNKLKQITNIAFGTDSTLSAEWNLWNHLRLARSQNLVSDHELYNMLTVSPAGIWNMNGIGKLENTYDADIVVAKRNENTTGFNAYYSLNPEDILLVIHKGNIRLFDAKLLEQINDTHTLTKNFSKVVINKNTKYIYGDVPALMKQIKGYYEEANFPIECDNIQ